MKIVNAIYASRSLKSVVLTMDDGSEVVTAIPNKTLYADAILRFLKSGRKIRPYRDLDRPDPIPIGHLPQDERDAIEFLHRQGIKLSALKSLLEKSDRIQGV